MAARLFRAFQTGYRLISGNHLNDLFQGNEAMQAIAVTGAAVLSGGTTITGGGSIAGGGAITGAALSGTIFTPNAPAAAAGTNLATATQLSVGFTLVTASDGTKGVALPAVPTPGALVVLFNSVAAQPLIIYPDGAAGINAIAAHAALTCANGVPVILYATSATQWYSLPLLPS